MSFLSICSYFLFVMIGFNWVAPFFYAAAFDYARRHTWVYQIGQLLESPDCPADKGEENSKKVEAPGNLIMPLRLVLTEPLNTIAWVRT